MSELLADELRATRELVTRILDALPPVEINGVKAAISWDPDLEEALVQVIDAHPGPKVERLQRWVNDLQSKMYVNCVYCGHRYGPSATTAVTQADALKAHIEICPEHPMSKLKEQNKLLLESLKELLEQGSAIHGDDLCDERVIERARRMIRFCEVK